MKPRIPILVFLSLHAIVILHAEEPAPRPTELASHSAEPAPAAAEPITAAEVYGEGVRPTSWLSPDDERAGFRLPPGFEIRLFAAEPEIAKPLNMAFAADGSMWMTQSLEYPYPAKEGEVPSDAVMVLRDTDGDGRADSVRRFADKLNIPMGVLPYGNGCLCFSIPNLWYLQDTDGDGECDRRDVVLGPFDTTRDTHGMINSLRDGGDGWVYACHGFNNQSQVAGTDGHVVTMHSGNTFRFRPDGSRVELYTQGQVNPFGMTRDQWGYWYSADCHSKPISQLIRGACYPSFGRPDDGLGFLPPTVEHLHGSTAISGLIYIAPDSPIRPLRGQFLSGNVMTSRLNRNLLSFDGATAKGTELGDFMTSDDPWFRPVDLQLGKDGFIYVADFYNKIIGHYEVPLEHPGRDRHSGRVWQIRYIGPSDQGSLDDNEAIRRVESWKVATESETPTSFIASIAAGLDDPNPHVVRAAVEFTGVHGNADHINPLLERLDQVPASDPVLRQTIRIAARNLLRDVPDSSPIWNTQPPQSWLPILKAISAPGVSRMLVSYLRDHPDVDGADELLMHAVSSGGEESVGDFIPLARRMAGPSTERGWQLLGAIALATRARPGHVAPQLREWALELVGADWDAVRQSPPTVVWATRDGKPWGTESRKTASDQAVAMHSSFPRTEAYTGVLSSDEFSAPQQITFLIAGHNGFPNQPDSQLNRVRLVSNASGKTIQESFPPRSDVATPVRWDTSQWAGQSVRIEIIDGDSGGSYAWIAVGNFEPKSLTMTTDVDPLQRAMEWTKRLGLTEMVDRMKAVLGQETLSPRAKVEIASTMSTVLGRHGDALLLHALHSQTTPSIEIEQAIRAIESNDLPAIEIVTKQICHRMTANDQINFARSWATSPADPQRLIAMVEAGWIGAAALADESVSQSMAAKTSPAQQSRIAKLSQSSRPDSRATERLARLQLTLPTHVGNNQAGKALFIQHCAACHQLRGEGQVVGPQLDGASARNQARLLEDIVTPNQNVDEAFRVTSLLLDDGRVLVGMVVSETPQSVRLVDSLGKPNDVQKDAIEQRRDGGQSLMPGNFGDLIADQPFADLIHFIRNDP